MIPSTSGFLTTDLELERQPSRTYKMNLEGDTTRGFTDELDAMKQAVFKILNGMSTQCIPGTTALKPWIFMVNLFPGSALSWKEESQKH